MLLILYGPAGAGKTTLGKALAADVGALFYDADQDLLPEMREYIARNELFPQALRDRYARHVATRINACLQVSRDVIVAQALIKQVNRDFFAAQFPLVRFVAITANRETLLARIAARADHVSPVFAERILQAFEPSMADLTVNNEEIIPALALLRQEWAML